MKGTWVQLLESKVAFKVVVSTANLHLYIKTRQMQMYAAGFAVCAFAAYTVRRRCRLNTTHQVDSPRALKAAWFQLLERRCRLNTSG